jgi:hypothetical protein
MLAMKLGDFDGAGTVGGILDFADGDADVALELAFYHGNGFGEASNRRFARLPEARKSVHLNHRQYSLLDFAGDGRHRAEARLATDMAFMDRLGIGGGAVIHAARDKSLDLGMHPETGETVVYSLPPVASVRDGMLHAADRMGQRGPLFIENTYESLAWFRDLFAGLAGRGLEGRVGFCLDIGHARVWNSRPLPEWLDFCGDLSGQGFRLHAHVHCNAGDRDSHLPLSEGQRLGLFAPSIGYAPNGLLQEIVRLDALCSDECLVLENHSSHATANLEWTRNIVASRAGLHPVQHVPA